MVKKNFSYFKKIEKVDFIGFSSIFDKLIEINKDNDIRTIVITSSDQAKKIDEKIKLF
jgi:hypothetical protein